MKIFIPITKVDVVKREVYGVMAEEAVDKSGEVFDYASSKPLVQKWSEQFEKATAGKSYGNVRIQHGSAVAGKISAIEFDDVNKCIPIVAKVVDDNAWKMVEEGVFTGFSIGGKYKKRWTDGQVTRYTAEPSEVSLVDNPCMYGALFTAVKADGAQEMRKFIGRVKKSMWDVGTFASILDDLSWMRDCLASENEYEGDDSEIPAKLAAWIEAGIPILKQLVDEESAELTDAEKIAKSNKEQPMTAEEKLRFDALEKENKELRDAAALTKAAEVKAAEDKAKTESSEKIVGLEKAIAELAESNKALNEGLQKLLATPETPKAAASANGGVIAKKDGDVADGKEVDLSKLAPMDAIKHIHGSLGRAETPRGPA